MALSLVGTPTTSTGSGTTIGPCNVPTGTTTDDLLIWCMANQNASAVPLPSGWTEIRSASGTALGGMVCYRWATSSEPSSYSNTGAPSGKSATVMVSIRGADKTTGPFDGTVPAALTDFDGSTETISLPSSVAAATGGAWVCGVPLCTWGSGVSTGFTGTNADSLDVSQSSSGGGANVGAAFLHELLASPGSFSPTVTTTADSVRHVGVAFSLKPAGGSSVTGQAVASFGGTFTASGKPTTFGAAAATLGGSFTALGIDRAVGAAVASFGFTGTASGTSAAPPVEGQATGSFGFTGTAAGIVTVRGAATAPFGFTAAAAGVDRATGAAVATFGFTGSAAGIDRAIGAATAAFGFTSEAAAHPTTLGAATGLFGFTGTAAGGVGDQPTTGTAAATFGFTGTAVGVDRVLGVATATFGFAGTSLGIDQALGAAAAAFGFTATAAATVLHTGTGTATFGFTATATGDSGEPASATPAERTVTVEVELRVAALPHENRTVVVTDARILALPPESRTITIT